jgi:D-cysteine desulfhydrase
MRIGMNEYNIYPALFHRYPNLENNISRLAIGSLPTTVQSLKNLGYNNLWIKRDDLSSRVYGGNKVRKLAFILADVQRKRLTHVITPGGIGTHHGLATTIFGNRFGIHTTLLLFRQPITANVRQTLLLLTHYGAKLQYKKTLFRAMLWYYIFCRIRFPGAYYLYPGGSNPVGTVGYVDAAFELKQQIHDGLMPKPDIIFCPLGSGGTLAGLTLGMALSDLSVSVIGIRVSLSHLGLFPATTIGTVKDLMRKTYQYLKQMDASLPDIVINTPAIMDTYLGDGYGHPTAAGGKAYQLMKDRQGITLDPTYTAKTFAAVLDYCKTCKASPETVLFWNTYNGVDLTDEIASANYNELPVPLQRLMEADTLA